MLFTELSFLEIALGLLALIATAYLGLTVYLRNPQSWTNRFFALLALDVFAYILINPISLHPPLGTPENQLFWIRMVMFTVAFMTPILFLLVHTFPKKEIQLSKKYLIALLIFMGITAALALGPFVFEALEYPGGEPVPRPGLGMPIFFIEFVGLIVLSFVVMILKYKRAVGVEKVKHLYLLLGVVATFTLMTISTIVFVVILETSIGVFLGPIYPVILTAFIAYAIVKHRFLDIQPIIARAVSYSLLIAIIAAVYAGSLLLGTALVVKKASLDITTTVISLAMAIAAAITFQPLHALIRKFTDKLFFKGFYDSEKLISELTRSMNETIDLDVLSNKILNTITKELRITKAAFLFLDGHSISAVKSSGYNEKNLLQLPLEKLIHDEMLDEHSSISLLDLQSEEAQNLFRKYEIEVLIPMLIKQKEVAVLIVGAKASGEAYNQIDYGFLDILAPEAGIAIQNARLYTDLKVISESKNRFISVVSHQLRTPIASMRWSLEMLKNSKIAKDKKTAFLNNAYEGSVFLGDQVDDIITALDIYDKKIFIKKSRCNIYEICKKVGNEFAGVVKSKRIKIDYVFDEGLSRVLAEGVKLEKIVHILLKNAIVYSFPGNKVILTAKLERLAGKKRLLIFVSDKGMGIIESEKDHIFEEFFRSDRARTAYPNGLGLGMFIAKAFARAHGGDIWFSSAGELRGADFYFSIPVGRAGFEPDRV